MEAYHNENEIEAAFVKYAIPTEYGSSEMFREDESFDPCKMYLSNFTSVIQDIKACSPLAFDNSTVVPCDKFVYDKSVFIATLTTELDLVCEDGDSKQRLLGSMMMLGLLLGSCIGGWLSDTLGRKIITPVGFGISKVWQLLTGTFYLE